MNDFPKSALERPELDNEKKKLTSTDLLLWGGNNCIFPSEKINFDNKGKKPPKKDCLCQIDTRESEHVIILIHV